MPWCLFLLSVYRFVHLLMLTLMKWQYMVMLVSLVNVVLSTNRVIP